MTAREIVVAAIAECMNRDEKEAARQLALNRRDIEGMVRDDMGGMQNVSPEKSEELVDELASLAIQVLKPSGA